MKKRIFLLAIIPVESRPKRLSNVLLRKSVRRPLRKNAARKRETAKTSFATVMSNPSPDQRVMFQNAKKRSLPKVVTRSAIFTASI